MQHTEFKAWMVTHPDGKCPARIPHSLPLHTFSIFSQTMLILQILITGGPSYVATVHAEWTSAQLLVSLCRKPGFPSYYHSNKAQTLIPTQPMICLATCSSAVLSDSTWAVLLGVAWLYYHGARKESQTHQC